MKIGLFDLYSTGHHQPYASRTKRAIESVSEHTVRFITFSESEQCTRLFNKDDIIYLEDPQSPPIEERDENFDTVADRMVRKFFSTGTASRFDVVHFLFSDDILGTSWRNSLTTSTSLIGELNGVFFKRGTFLRQRYVHGTFLKLLQSPVRRGIDAVVPGDTDHEQLWRDLHLYRCLERETFDHLITHSYEAEEYVTKLDPQRRTPRTMIPYPAPEDYGTMISQEEARKELNLPLEDSILLFFGSLRKEKGIDRLLRVLRQYSGPAFTMLIAGPPKTVTEQKVRQVQSTSQLKILTHLEYIDEPERYYRAADAMVLPYIWEFGRECTSQSLDEACSALLPVIVPDFGAVGRLTKQWELGMIYEQGSDKALDEALVRFGREGISYSERWMRQYNNRHSHKNAAKELVSIYEKLVP